MFEKLLKLKNRLLVKAPYGITCGNCKKSAFQGKLSFSSCGDHECYTSMMPNPKYRAYTNHEWNGSRL